MQSVRSLDPQPGRRLTFAMSAEGRWRIDGNNARLPAEIANDGEGNLVIRVLDPKTLAVIAEERIAA